MSIAPTIHKLVLDLAQGQQPMDGMLFYNQVSALNLAYNDESLAKLDDLLSKISIKASKDPRFQPEQLAKLAGGNMFYLTLVGYLGNFISRKLSKVSAIQTSWQGAPDFAMKIQNEAQNINQLAQSLVFTTGDHQNFPLTAIIEKLKNGSVPEKSLKEFVAVTLNKNGMSVPSLTQPKVEPVQQMALAGGGGHASPYVNNNDEGTFKGVTPELLAQIQAQKKQLTDMHNVKDERLNLSGKKAKSGLGRLAKEIIGGIIEDDD